MTFFRYAIVFIILCLTFIVVKFSWNSQYINSFESSLKKWQISAKHHLWDDDFLGEQEQLRLKFNNYEMWLEKTHLEDGMVVNRYRDQVVNECDSLLFSSLRYVALQRVNHVAAASAWEGIKKSFLQNNRWVRHPKCPYQALSRDMLLGVLSALLYRPRQEAREMLVNLMRSIDNNKGYITDGPFYVSLVTPGILEIMRRMAFAFDVSASEVPKRFQYGFSTIEWSMLGNPKGYRTHLIALQIWVEIFLKNEAMYNKESAHKSLLSSIELWIHQRAQLDHQRLVWSLQELMAQNPANLFFKWLYLEANSATSPGLRHQVISELLEMTEFPDKRLPAHCDRKADYLWQREISEYEAGADCELVWAGVDFLWMASLLIIQ